MVASDYVFLLLSLSLSVNANAECEATFSKNISDRKSFFFTSCDLMENTVSLDLENILSNVSCVKRVHIRNNQREVLFDNPSKDITVKDAFETNCTREAALKITIEDRLGKRLSLMTTVKPFDCFRNGTLAFKVGQNEKVSSFLKKNNRFGDIFCCWHN